MVTIREKKDYAHNIKGNEIKLPIDGKNERRREREREREKYVKINWKPTECDVKIKYVLFPHSWEFFFIILVKSELTGFAVLRLLQS